MNRHLPFCISQYCRIRDDLSVQIRYTLLQKKRNFSEPIFPGDPGSLTLTPGHVHFVKWFLE